MHQPPSFQVLHRSQNIHRSYLLEASAGTGKTFSIENIVLRLLIESEPECTIDKILVVTFTRAATQELKQRIRQTLVKTLEIIQSKQTEKFPDFLLAIYEKNGGDLDHVRKTVEQALFCFDQSHIHTIHGFCSQMLRQHGFEGGMNFQIPEDSNLSPTKILSIIRDFFRTGVREELFSKEQLKIVLKEYGSIETLENALQKIITSSSEIIPSPTLEQDSVAIFSRMAYECQKMLKNYINEEERQTHDELLVAMWQGLQLPNFVKSVRAQFRAAIIDEFQDTDPLQWKIFKKLFAANPYCALYLVGDPKQSIYSFRQADIYTYLEAADTLGKAARASLDTNYRSQPSLVTALNTLFSSAHIKEFMPLPRTKSFLDYTVVNSSPNRASKAFQDDHGSLHFFIAKGKKAKKWPSEAIEDDYFFPFIAREIQKLVKREGFVLKDCAILVRDRYQARRMIQFLKQSGMAAVSQENENLADSPAVEALQELLTALLHLRDFSKVKQALGGKILMWTHAQMRQTDESQTFEKALFSLTALRKVLFEKGFSLFFHELMRSCWHGDGQSVMEKILSQHDGITLYRDLEQCAEVIADYEKNSGSPPDALLRFISTFPQLKFDNDERLLIQDDPDRDAIQIRTMHASKGLEFPIVFALGLANRISAKEELFPLFKDDKIYRVAPTSEREKEFLLQKEESDGEKMRQLYVAMTRAKYRLYVPIALCEEKKEIEHGTASPMDLFLARFGRGVLSHSEIYDTIANENGEKLMQFIDREGKDFSLSYEVLNNRMFDKRGRPSAICDSETDLGQQESSNAVSESQITEATAPFVNLQSPQAVIIPQFYSAIHSFSSLAKKAGQNSLLEDVPHGLGLEKTIHTMPAGAETGIMLHKILETLTFEDFKLIKDPQECLTIIQKILHDHPLKDWDQAIAEMLFHLFKAPFAMDGERFSLSEISKTNCYIEMEFLYPMRGTSDYLKGFIDLAIMHNNKYYLIDWKSNWLGKSNEDYNQENLRTAMQANDYFSQAKIYAEAFKKYLRLIDRRTFEECFGGFFFIFLRGIDGSGSSGIYKIKADEIG